MAFVVLCLTLTMLLCAHLLWKCSYWQRHGVRGPRGLPILGNMWEFFLGRRHYGDVYKNIYDAHPHLPYIGIYRLFNEPAVLVRSQEMIKEVMIRSFQHFQDNVLWVDEKRDPIVCYNPFIAKGVQWKQMRAEILPIFTPNKLFSKYTLDVVASAAYGLDGAALTNTNSDFTQLVENLFLPHAWSLLETIALLFSPQLGNLIKYHYVPTGVQDWLQGIIGKVLEIRCASVGSAGSAGSAGVSVKSNDFIQWLIEGKQKLHEPVDATTIVGHCSTFLLEGFETSSSLMAFALHEYAKNPLVQKRVQQEIDEVLARHGGDICYDAIQEMSYLGATLYETLRLYPPMMALLKHCTKEFELPAQSMGGKSFKVPVGMVFVIPVKGVHYDADLYEKPLQFQPERFLNQNEKTHGCMFLGFGEGPRMCPGMRFGLAQSKAGIVTLLSKYSVHLCENNKPFKMSAKTFLTATDDGIWISFEERKFNGKAALV
ncbi:PREDICTED: probable cytochrome P450 308a1 isoform X2 [Rhagoletis zephyria]|uniref:probable cytochrome P450 308a1 isoform X2 n=1 Tax=Rhagoletis zephyria TaxID=28612 RepID=UPI0008116117|nr:PREDICTED: probable cytochrome P450 308a1 isoform X2 [Rhagoletis zephyria]